MKTRITLAAAALLVTTAALAQAPQKKDPQASYEPRSGPGAGQAYLSKFAGDWDVAKTFFPRSGEPARSRGTCRQTMIHGGRFLQSDFVFGEGDRASDGRGVIGFEPETGQFTSVWTDSRQTRMSLRQSRKEDAFDGKRIVLYSKSLEPETKETRRSRTVSELSADGRTLTHRQYALGPDGQERLMMELVMTRTSSTSSKTAPSETRP
ncbi:MAG: DUF1579 family protein [Isosphaeraceae bacterium]